MANGELGAFHAHVRHRLRHFLWDTRSRKSARADALRRIMARGWRSCLFGGVVRDVFVKSPWVKTRDIDIVVADVTLDDLIRAFEDVLVRKTRFGGLTLNMEGWLFDIWPLQSTWGCRFFPLFANSFELLPQTTFFSVEAIAVELLTSSGVPRMIYQDRFHESVARRTIMLNLKENPFPELCIVRAFALARKLDFTLHFDLVRHLAGWARKTTPAKIERAMLGHYGRAAFSRRELLLLVNLLRAHADSGCESPMTVPREQQMMLPFSWPEPIDHFLAGRIESPAEWQSSGKN